jgi:hypothetical protein
LQQRHSWDYQDLTLLLKVRNQLVHFKPNEIFTDVELTPETLSTSRNSAVEQLRSRHVLANDIVGLTGWTAWIETKAMAKWSCSVVSHLVVDFVSKTPAEGQWGIFVRFMERAFTLEMVIGGIRFYGVDWRSPAAIPAGVDVVVSHCPAKGMVDQRQPPTSEHLGDGWLAKQIEVVNPRLVVSGHFHGGYGRVERDGTTFVNCSLANEARELANEPQIVDLEPREF